MKIILGDNQFFGVNHFDLNKGEITKSKFENPQKINNFINDSLRLGLDGFMINSNKMGFDIISNGVFIKNKEIHYSIPYPHKYANIINEKGMLSLLFYVLKNTSILNNIIFGIKLIISSDAKYIIPLAVDLEKPKNLPKGSYVYMQNIITDLLVGMGRVDLLIDFILYVKKKGYNPGLITLNPVFLDKLLKTDKRYNSITNLIVCFNINAAGFNVFPSQKSVEDFAKSKHKYKLMGMSIFASGAGNIKKSIQYIKKFKLDYVVFGSSNLSNIKSNFNLLKK